jgi:hypothetical protein
MTDRIKGVTVTLDENIREDDAEAILNAIRMIKGVIDVDAHIADINHYMAVAQAKNEIRQDMIGVLYPSTE